MKQVLIALLLLVAVCVVERPLKIACAEGSIGSVYISDSMKGRIWKIVYTGS